MNIIDTKPILFFKTNCSIWTDPYIQKNLLDAHLNTESDAASRNTLSISTTIDFIHNTITKNSKIMDLGCGPGIYAELLSEKGHHVTGVDFNVTAINYAIENTSQNQFKHADYIKSFPYDNQQYDAITMIYCDMGTHSDNDRDALLTNCFHSLKSGGTLIFDVFNQNIIDDRKEYKSWEFFADSGFWSDKPHLVLSQLFHYPDNHAFASQYNLLVEGVENQYFLIWERYYDENEIIAVLSKIGFNNIHIKKELLKSNNFTSNHVMFVVAEK